MLLTISILAAVVAWIVFSYLPAHVVELPQFQYATGGVVRFFPGILIAGLLVFGALQVWLIYLTADSVRRYRETDQRKPASRFNLSIAREALLTALPIAFTLLVAVASVNWWQQLTAID